MYMYKYEYLYKYLTMATGNYITYNLGNCADMKQNEYISDVLQLHLNILKMFCKITKHKCRSNFHIYLNINALLHYNITLKTFSFM